MADNDREETEPEVEGHRLLDEDDANREPRVDVDDVSVHRATDDDDEDTQGHGFKRG